MRALSCVVCNKIMYSDRNRLYCSEECRRIAASLRYFDTTCKEYVEKKSRKKIKLCSTCGVRKCGPYTDQCDMCRNMTK